MAVETCVIPFSGLPGDMYDLQIPLILYLILFRPVREIIFSVVFMGAAMDGASSGPYGIYSMTYLLIFVSSAWILRFLRSGNRLLLPFFMIYGVLVENLVLFGTCCLPGSMVNPPSDVLTSVVQQAVWAFLTGVFLMEGIRHSHKRWIQWMDSLFPGETNGEEGRA